MEVTIFGLDVSFALVLFGVVTGATYGILAVGLVLVYRSNKVINFAHGEIGAFGAATCGLMAVKWGVPFWVAYAAGITVSAGLGAGAEVVVVRRLRNAPRLMSLVATLGMAQFLLLFSSVVNSHARASSRYPLPAGMPEFRVGGLLMTKAYSAMLILSPIVVLVLVVFLRRSRFGIGVRAAAANVERARMVGISAARMSTLTWAIAGAVAAFTTVLIIPTRGFLSAETLGPALLLRALAPAVIARMTSLPIAFGAGIGVGVVDQVLLFNHPASGVSEVFLFGVIAVTLLFQARQGSRAEDRQEWGMIQPWGVLPDAFRRVWMIRNLGRITGAFALGGAILVGIRTSNSTAVTLVSIIAFSLIGLSLGIVSGLGGQLSLGQFALAGVGATASYIVSDRVGNFVLALLVAALVAAVVSVLLGLPALRVRGLLLGVVTLSFALAAQRWLLAQSWALGDGVSAERPVLGSFELDTTRRYYFWALAVLVIGFWLAGNVWRGAVGLRLRAVRDNEDGARAFGVSATAVKLQGFAIGGVLVGLAGSVYGHLLSLISAGSFDVVTSIHTVALTVLGGIGMLAGPLLGAFYIIGVPRFLPLDNAGLAATSFGWLLLILYFPGGIASLVAVPRRRVIHWLARRHGIDPVAVESGAEADVGRIAVEGLRLEAPAPTTHPDSNEVLLRAENLVRHFGGVRAVDGVDLTLKRGEVLGLIGPNGAGKTTLFELLGGFTKPDAGSVEFLGRDVTNLAPELRARLGLIRSFQDAALFSTLTVLESVTFALERRAPTNVLFSSLGMQELEKLKDEEARRLLSLMGLDSFRNKQIRELSTGTRRITELACIVALQPVVLLLDEPSSGIAQRESEALAEVLLRIRDHLDCTLIIVEHDIPLLMRLSSRVIAMDSGTVIAVGSPEEVRHNPLVVTSYLGGDAVAIERSGTRSSSESVPDGRCQAITRAGHRCTRPAGDDGVCPSHRRAKAVLS